MRTVKLREDEWKKIHDFLRECSQVYVGSAQKCRRFVEGVLWVSRSGAQWRLLPAEYGNWNSVYKRFARWCEAGVWEQMLAHFADDPDMENVMVDSTIVRAHPSAAGALKKREDKALKRSDAAEAGSVPNSM
jgi:transposase